jgi:hypothetical protein
MMTPKIKNQKIETFIRITAYSMMAIGLVILFGRKTWWPSFYNPIYLFLSLFISACLIIASQYVYKAPDDRRQESISRLRLVLTVVLILNILGEFYLYQLYKSGVQYDKLIHFASSFLLLVALTWFYEKWYKLKFSRALKYAVITVIAGSLFWELFEFSADLIFKTTMFGMDGKYKLLDTTFDILSDFLGIGLGSVYAAWCSWRQLFFNLLGFKRGLSPAKAVTGSRCYRDPV